MQYPRQVRLVPEFLLTGSQESVWALLSQSCVPERTSVFLSRHHRFRLPLWLVAQRLRCAVTATGLEPTLFGAGYLADRCTRTLEESLPHLRAGMTLGRASCAVPVTLWLFVDIRRCWGSELKQLVSRSEQQFVVCDPQSLVACSSDGQPLGSLLELAHMCRAGRPPPSGQGRVAQTPGSLTHDVSGIPIRCRNRARLEWHVCAAVLSVPPPPPLSPLSSFPSSHQLTN